MSRILLADDSPHALRMGERILREEGFEVVSVTDGETALLRLPDVDPDLLIVDASLIGTCGYDVCERVKKTARHRHVRVILTAGLLESFDEERARRVHSDAMLRKPFEASAMMDAVRSLVDSAQLTREALVEAAKAPPEPEIDPERVRAAVTIALDAAFPALLDQLTERVLEALKWSERSNRSG